MKYFKIVQCLIFLMTVGLGLFIAGCPGDSTNPEPNFSLSDYIEVVVQKVKNQGAIAKAKDTALEIRACLINKTADEIQVFFNSRQYKSAGGFRIRIGTEVYAPDVRLGGTGKYNNFSSNYGLLPGYGRREFDLLFYLPESQARQVLTAPETTQVFLIVYGLRHKNTHTDIFGPKSEIIGRWEKSKEEAKE